MPAMRLVVRLLGRRLPRRSGTLRLTGVEGRVRIRRDGWGIPHIDATSEADAWFGLGFCHAQDRAFQLETLLRVGRGTLSALVGPGGLFSQQASPGFIELWSLQSRMAYRLREREE